MRVPLAPLVACGTALMVVPGAALGQAYCSRAGETLINEKYYTYGNPKETVTIALSTTGFLEVQCEPPRYALSGAVRRGIGWEWPLKTIVDSVTSYRCGNMIYKELQVRRDCRDTDSNKFECDRKGYWTTTKYALVDLDGKEWALDDSNRYGYDRHSSSISCGEWGYMRTSVHIYPLLERADVPYPEPLKGYSVHVKTTETASVVSVRNAEVPRF